MINPCKTNIELNSYKSIFFHELPHQRIVLVKFLRDLFSRLVPTDIFRGVLFPEKGKKSQNSQKLTSRTVHLIKISTL